MKVEQIDVQMIRLPFRFAFKHSLAKRDFSVNVLVRVVVSVDGARFIGWGESVPRDYVTGETVEGACALVEKMYAPAFVGKELGTPYELKTLLEEKFQEFDLGRLAKGATWCALECAILDAYARAKQWSVSQLLVEMGVAQTAVAPLTSIVYGGVAPFAGGAKAKLLFLLLKFYQYKTVKIKVGRSLEQDIEAVSMARRMLGSETIIRVDANCAWSTDDTMRFYERTKHLSVASIEQPLKPDDMKGLASLTADLPIAILVDESLCTYNQGEELIRSRAASGFNVRVSKNGGLLASLKLIKLARQAGLEVHLGAQVGESGVLTAAQRQLALVAGPLANIEGAANFFLLKRDLTHEDLTARRGGCPPELKSNVGLGVSVSESKLAELAVSLDERGLLYAGSLVGNEQGFGVS